MRRWFVTWNRPEYKEWATKSSKGYLLVILRREPDRYVCVKANLLVGARGLPEFKVLEELHIPDEFHATNKIREWKR